MDRRTFSSQPGTLPWLVEIMKRLLAPDGCPWDREQTLQTLRPFLLEECYEVLDAIDGGDPDEHCEELGDLLFQVIFQAELGQLSTTAIISGIGDKLIRRHPHVFGDASVNNTDDVLRNWDRLKAAEKTHRKSALDGVPRAMPALLRSQQLVQRAARSGFGWPDVARARAKVDEELREADRALADTDIQPAAQTHQRALRHEIGDLLFAIVGWADRLGVDAEQVTRDAAARFTRRFSRVESAAAAAGKQVADYTPAQLLSLWHQAGSEENGAEDAE